MSLAPRKLAALLVPPLAALALACGPDTSSALGSDAPGRFDSPAIPSAPAATKEVPPESGDLVARVQQVPLSGDGTGEFQPPSDAELDAFRSALEGLLRGASEADVEALAALGFRTSLFQHTDGNSYLLVEDAVPGRGGGTVIINRSPARLLWLEAPHANSDLGTLRQSAAQLVALGARALIITGTHRCTSAESTPCDGASTICDGRLRTSDAAHFPWTFFTAAHEALRRTFPDELAVSLHGMANHPAEAALISDGTQTPREGSIANRLRDALNRRLPENTRAYSCNAADDAGEFRPLCGTTNVQGRIDNGSADACSSAAPGASDRFLHIEQGEQLRATTETDGVRPEAIIEALGEVVPPSL